ncbi:cupin domain-containing protein [Piscinibacter aquaticus]|uniref:Cupin domain-containing protein n=1 Tax=Piscinibacter aquaticus TaxID=392597 RepID=A0A5C6TP95_9BURK|nr:cupin domain-containing protein [Piscinibacter aquaticus]
MVQRLTSLAMVNKLWLTIQESSHDPAVSQRRPDLQPARHCLHHLVLPRAAVPARTPSGEVTVEPGVAGSPHRLTREETFVALEGSAVVEVDGQRHELAAGSALVVAAGQTLALSNTASRPFRALAVLPVGGQAVIGDGPAFTPPWAA